RPAGRLVPGDLGAAASSADRRRVAAADHPTGRGTAAGAAAHRAPGAAPTGARRIRRAYGQPGFRGQRPATDPLPAHHLTRRRVAYQWLGRLAAPVAARHRQAPRRGRVTGTRWATG